MLIEKNLKNIKSETLNQDKWLNIPGDLDDFIFYDNQDKQISDK